MSHAALPVAALPALDGMCFKGLGGPLSGFVTPAACACGGPSVRGSRRKCRVDLLLEPAGLGDRGPTPSFWEKTLLLSLPLGTARGSLKVHSTGQTAQWLQGPAPPASASLMQERKGVRSLGPLSRPREVARAEAEGGQEASFLSPSSLAGLRAQTGKGPVSAQGARHSTHSHV